MTCPQPVLKSQRVAVVDKLNIVGKLVLYFSVCIYIIMYFGILSVFKDVTILTPILTVVRLNRDVL